VDEGDFLIVDSTEGVVRVNPDDVVRAQYRLEREREAEIGSGEGMPDWAQGPHSTADGTDVSLVASCGNLPQVCGAIDLGMSSIGLYRTELLFLLERNAPSLESLTNHYAAVIEGARGKPVTFRLLDVDSSIEVGYLHEQREHNPALGRAGVRLLLEREQILREQLKALLLAASGSDVRIVIPLINDCGELRRVKEILYEERFALRRDDAPRLSVGVIVETPVAALGLASLIEESDFAMVGLDSLLQYMLAADRENLDLDEYFEPLHPVVLRVLADLVSVCGLAGKPLSVFGSAARRSGNVPMLLGAGFREFCVSPVDLESLLNQLRTLDLAEVKTAFAQACKATCQAETQPHIESLRREPTQ
jgi:phosphoenolpyruvate-protein kinase (PTS system EI component)